MAPLILYVFTKHQPALIVLATVFTVGQVALSLFLLPRFKGMIVDIRWVKRRYRFDNAKA